MLKKAEEETPRRRRGFFVIQNLLIKQCSHASNY